MRVALELDGRVHELVLAKAPDGGWQVEADGEAFAVRLERNGSGVVLRVGDRSVHVELARDGEARIDGRAVRYRVQSVEGSALAGPAAQARATHVRPPMNGKLEKLLVSAGQSVAKGDVLFVLEAMKMHNEVKAPVAGRVAAVHLQEGATVEPRQVVLDLEPA